VACIIYLLEQMELRKAIEDHWKVKEEAHREREDECRNMEHLFEAQWKAKEDAFKEKEDVFKEKEDVCKEKEEECKAHDHLFNEWERIKLNIQQLSNALATKTNELLKHDMQSDIIALINRKELIANKFKFSVDNACSKKPSIHAAHPFIAP